DQVLTGVTLHPRSGLVGGLELLLGDLAVVTLELLLGTQLQAIVAHLALAALAVLTRAVRAAVHRGRRTAPDVLAHAAVEFMLGALALRHASYPSICCRCPDGSALTRHRTDGLVHRGHRFTGVRGQLAKGEQLTGRHSQVNVSGRPVSLSRHRQTTAPGPCSGPMHDWSHPPHFGPSPQALCACDC